MDCDRNLQQSVIDELSWEPSVDPAHIGVVVDKGVVTLTGHVTSYAQKYAAEIAAARVKGIKAVAQEIEVRLPNSKKRADDEIAARVINLLNWDERIPNERINVKVQHGIVTLTGSVDWQYQKIAAEQDVDKLSGVVGVNNYIAIDAVAKSNVVCEEIEASFKRMAALDAAGIIVKVDGHRIVLSGNVYAPQERKLAERAAWSAPGIKEVQNNILVA